VGAVLVAVVMIVAAVLIRDLVIEGDDSGGGGGGGGGPAGPVRLVCVSEVRAACEQLADEDDGVEVTIASAGTTLDELTSPEFRGSQSAYDAWVTLDPLPEVVDARRDQQGDDQVLADPTPVASSPVVLVASNDRADALVSACGEPSDPDSDDVVVSVRCVAEAAGGPWSAAGGEGSWGPVRYGFVDPDRQAEGQAVLGQLATAYFAELDPPLGPDAYASNDFAPLGFSTWLGGVAAEADTSSQGGTPLEKLVQRGPSAFGAVATLEASATDAIAGTRAEGSLTVIYPSPMATAVVSLAPVGGAPGADDVDDVLEPLREALAGTGWDVDDPTAAGLPRPGVADALDRLWGQVS
jgi:hypothetical protein